MAEEYRVSQKACEELLTIPGVRNCGSHIGQAFVADEMVGVNVGENWISIDPTRTTTRRSQQSRKSWTAIPAFTATSRHI